MTGKGLPLSGVRVVEFTHAVMGPVAGLILSDMGAEVIRVEPAPNGDHTRRLEGFGTGYYTFFNRNKKSLAVDLKTKDGREVVSRLLAKVDVVIENFGPGTIDRLGFGYDAVKQINPQVIYCSLKGFMPGPYENRPALDEVVQMMSGLAYMTGPAGKPLRAGASVIDIMGGTYGALGIITTLRTRDQTGQGGLVQNGLFETAVFIMGQHMAYAAFSEAFIPPMPDRISAWAIYRIFDTHDGKQVFIGITSDKQWEAFCKTFDRPDLLADESLGTNKNRIAQRARLIPDLEMMFQAMPLSRITELSEGAGISFSPISHPEDLFDDPQLNEGDSLLTVTLPDGRQARLPRLPLALDGERFDLYADAPSIGEHTVQILQELGYGDEAIQQLHQSRTIVAAEHESPSNDSRRT